MTLNCLTSLTHVRINPQKEPSTILPLPASASVSQKRIGSRTTKSANVTQNPHPVSRYSVPRCHILVGNLAAWRNSATAPTLSWCAQNDRSFRGPSRVAQHNQRPNKPAHLPTFLPARPKRNVTQRPAQTQQAGTVGYVTGFNDKKLPMSTSVLFLICPASCYLGYLSSGERKKKKSPREY